MSTGPERPFDAVMFDWCGTLVEYPTDEDRFRPVLRRTGRPHDDASVAELVKRYQAARRHPAAVESDRRCDLSAGHHRAAKMLVCELAGIDSVFARELERSFGDFDISTTVAGTSPVDGAHRLLNDECAPQTKTCCRRWCVDGAGSG